MVSGVDELSGGDPEFEVRRERPAQGASRVAGRRSSMACDTDVVLDGKALGKPSDVAGSRAVPGSDVGTRARGAERPRGARRRRGADRGWNGPPSSSSRSPRPRRSATSRSGSGEGRSGGYAIQTLGSTLVERVEGSVSNVVGLPVGLLLELASELFSAGASESDFVPVAERGVRRSSDRSGCRALARSRRMPPPPVAPAGSSGR